MPTIWAARLRIFLFSPPPRFSYTGAKPRACSQEQGSSCEGSYGVLHGQPRTLPGHSSPRSLPERGSLDLLASRLFSSFKLYRPAMGTRLRGAGHGAALECLHRHVSDCRTPRLGTRRVDITTVHPLSSSEVRCSTATSSAAPGIGHLLPRTALLARHAGFSYEWETSGATA